MSLDASTLALLLYIKANEPISPEKIEDYTGVPSHTDKQVKELYRLGFVSPAELNKTVVSPAGNAYLEYYANTEKEKMKANRRDIFNMVLALFSIVLSIVFFIVQNACQN